MDERSPSPPRSRRESYYNAQRASSRSSQHDARTSSIASRSRYGSGGGLVGGPPPRSAGGTYSVPEDYEELSELAAPPPAIDGVVDRMIAQHHSPARSSRRGHGDLRPSSLGSNYKRSSLQQQSISGSRPVSRATLDAKKNTSIPDELGNLNELVGPEPVENIGEKGLCTHESLEEDRERISELHQDPPIHDDEGYDNNDVAHTAKSPSRMSGLYQMHEESLETQLAEAQAAAALATEEGHPQSALGEPRNRHTWAFVTELLTVSYLIFFSILGTLARVGIEWLGYFPGTSVTTSVLWANFAGSLFIGFLAEDRHLFREKWALSSATHQQLQPHNDTSSSSFEKIGRANRASQNIASQYRGEISEAAMREHVRIKKTIPLYIGLATGFCGSLTSFSSFMRDVFLALSNNLSTPAVPDGSVHRNAGYSLLAVVGVILTTVCLSLSALKLGGHLAIALDPVMTFAPTTFFRRTLDRLIVPLAFLSWLGAVILAIFPPDRPGHNSNTSWDHETWRGRALFACVFAPLGCLTRFYISLHLNGVLLAFPLGTFAVNVFGTAVEGMAYDLQHIPIGSGALGAIGGGVVSCQVLQGIMDGFCGCVTTVSTFVIELNGLRRRHAYIYGGASIVMGIVMVVAIMGSVRWSVGWSDPVCRIVSS